MSDVLIIGASGGIGSALCAAHTAAGYRVVPLSRRVDGFDVSDPASVAEHLGGKGPFDRVIVATGALEIDGRGPEKTVRRLDAEALAAQLRLNAIGPALVLAHAHMLLPRDRPSVFAILSARVGSIGDNRLGGWISYRTAKAAVNQIIRTSAIEIARTHPDARVVALHPGTVQTAFTEKYVGRHASVPAGEAAQNLMAVMAGLPSGETGRFLDYAGRDVPW